MLQKQEEQSEGGGSDGGGVKSGGTYSHAGLSLERYEQFSNFLQVLPVFRKKKFL